MEYTKALRIAEEQVERFRPACTRIEIKGSIARMKMEPNDIEIVAVPDMTQIPKAKIEFGKPMPKTHKRLVDALVAEMEEAGICTVNASGEKYKKFWLKVEKIQVDLFLVTPPAEWGVLSVIRTGPADFSHWMVTRKSRGGALPNDYIVEDGVVGQRVHTGKGDKRKGVISMPEEMDFFKFCGMDWIEPYQRIARW